MPVKQLFEIFIEKEVKDLQKVIFTDGINGLMSQFENWLYCHEIIDREMVKILRDE